MAKLIIIAAGTGSRLMPLTEFVPKPLVEISKGMTILDAAIKEIKASGVIDEVILIVGYRAEQIENHILAYNGIDVKTVYTPYYEVSGNLFSLWMASQYMCDDDVFITNADNIINSEVWKRMDKVNETCLALCKNPNLKEDDMKAYVLKDHVINVHKHITMGVNVFESVSLLKVCKADIKQFALCLGEMVREKANMQVYWPTIVSYMMTDGIYTKPIMINKSQWQEIDYHHDIMDLILSKRK